MSSCSFWLRLSVADCPIFHEKLPRHRKEEEIALSSVMPVVLIHVSARFVHLHRRFILYETVTLNGTIIGARKRLVAITKKHFGFSSPL